MGYKLLKKTLKICKKIPSFATTILEKKKGVLKTTFPFHLEKIPNQKLYKILY